MQESPDKDKQTLVVKIKVEPRSSRTEIVGPYREGWKVKLISPPVEGKANRELQDVLAGALKIKKNNVEIISGKTSRHKLVKLRGVALNTVREKLKGKQ
jgi:uncharacterized protein (TIGR00251 family)